MISILQEDLFSFLHCSINYALGRRSYITGVVAEQVRDYWKYLSPDQRSVLTRNLGSDIANYDRTERKLGDECDDIGWRNLHDWMIVNLEAPRVRHDG